MSLNMWIYKFKSLSSFRRDPVDLLLVSILVGFGFLFIYYLSQSLNPIILNEKYQDLWFDSDSPRVFSNMISRGGNHWRTKVHPLFSLMAYLPVFMLRNLLLVDAATAVRIFQSTIMGIWAAALFVLLRLVKCGRPESFLFVLLGIVSSASIFWFTVPETYPLGSLSILLAVVWVVLSEYRQTSMTEFVVIGVATLSFTITNWMVGIFATFLRFSWRKTFFISAFSLILVVGLNVVQKLIFPTAIFPFQPSTLQLEKSYIYLPNFERLVEVSRSIIFHTLVMPSLQILPQTGAAKFDQILTQGSSPGSAGVWGLVSIFLWLGLIGLAAWNWSRGGEVKIKIMLILSISGQFILHIFYGSETFLYSLHFLPLLIACVGFNVQAQTRGLTVLMTGVLILTVSINNLTVFHQARYILDKQADKKELVFSRTSKEMLQGIPANLSSQF